MFPDRKLVICDLDGTLVDSVPDLAFCVDEMLDQIDLSPAGEAKVRQWVGNGVERLVQRALLGEMEGEPDANLFSRALPVFLELYADNISQRSRLFPGVEQGLNWLAERKINLACVTNKAERYTTPLLKNLGICHRFGIVLSGDSLSEKKPSGLPLLHAAKHFGLQPENCLMVGDSISDVKAARAAGIAVVCLSYGYNHGMDIRTAEPDAVIDSLAELPALLAENLK
ncbi:MAG: phosphoglycolate phosphatase [Thermodesulfobacteriota bacterium]